MEFALGELCINLNGQFLNSLLAFYQSIIALLSEEVTTPFFNSKLLANYNKMISIMNMMDDKPLEQNGKGIINDLDYKEWIQE